MIWSKKKVDEDATTYNKTIEQLKNGQCPSFDQDRINLSKTVYDEFKDVLQQSAKKQPVLQEMDQISKIYAHSEFVNNLFHDELTRIKDLCLADLVSHPASPARATASTLALSTQIQAHSAPSLSRISLAAPEPPRSVSIQSHAGALQISRFIAHSLSCAAPYVPENTGEQAIELLRGPLKRPERAISKVIAAKAFCIECGFLFGMCCRCTVATREFSATFPTAFAALSSVTQ